MYVYSSIKKGGDFEREGVIIESGKYIVNTAMQHIFF